MAISKKRRKEVVDRDGEICQYCGEDLTDQQFILDHIIPKSKGGSHGSDNLAVCCVRCNLFKSDLLVEEFKEKASKKYKFFYKEIIYWDRVRRVLNEKE